MTIYPSVHVIILNWNHLDDLKMAINTFVIQDYSNLKIIIVDNGSTDGTLDYLLQYQTAIKLISNGENLGYAEGNNRGIKWALDNGADYVLLANNDIFSDDNKLISKIILSLKDCDHLNVGIYGIQERDFYSNDKIVSEGYFLFNDFAKPEKQFNVYRISDNKAPPPPYKYVDCNSGSFILINKLVFEKCGLLDNEFFMYHEEEEFSFRAWMNGFKVIFNPTFHYFHKVAQSSGKGSPFSTYYRIRNNFYFLEKHKNSIPYYLYFKRRYVSAVIISLFKKILVLPLKHNKKRVNIIRSIILALNDAHNNKYGYREIKNQCSL